MKVLVSTDGSGTSRGPGGWSAIIRYGDEYREISGGEPEATNNRMELTAVLKALQFLKRPCEVELTTDSEYVKKGIEEYMPAWRRRGWRTFEGNPVKNVDLWEKIDWELKRHRVEVVWVRGHGDHVDNCRADELAGMERRKLLGEPEKKSRVTLGWIDKCDEETIRAALDKLGPEKRDKLRRLLAA